MLAATNGIRLSTTYKPLVGAAIYIPYFSCSVPAGFPSPADDHIDEKLDLNELLIKNQPATFFATIEGDSMIGAGIKHGDTIIVDCSLEPKHNDIVVACVDGELTIKRLRITGNRVYLVPDNTTYSTREITGEAELIIRGVVTSFFRRFKA